MDQITLRFVGSDQPGLPLIEGMHGIGRQPDGSIGWLDDEAQTASVRFCADRRGVWLTVGDTSQGVHVNGRPVRRMAMLRMGDTVHADGAEIVLTGVAPPEPPPIAPDQMSGHTTDDPRVVLRGIGGQYHGRSFTLDRARLVGSGADSDIRIDDPAFAQHHGRIALQDGAIVLRGLDAGEGSIVNGVPVQDAILRPGDQVVFDAHQRFVVEAPGGALRRMPSWDQDETAWAEEDRVVAAQQAFGRSTRRLPWLLLAAVLIAASLAALLLFGVSG